MRQTVKVLSDVGITHSGAGENIVSAFQPATTFIENWNGEENRTIEIASFSFTDHPEEWTAQRNTPGVAYVNVAEVMANPGRLLAIKDMIREAKASGVLLVTVSIHWGPNYKWEPEKHFTEFARALIDAGADLVGLSASSNWF
jgi:poly-gamma-glutamate synthesis protein (capsule biosynthesis protein)